MTQAQFEQQLTDALNKRFGGEFSFAKKHVQEILDTVHEEAGRLLKKGEDVRIRGIGTIKVAKRPARKARMGRNPATGEDMKIAAKPASKKLRVLPAPVLKQRAGVK